MAENTIEKHIDMIMVNNRYMKGQELGPINHVKLRGVCEDLFIFDTKNGRFVIMNSDITKGIIELYNWPSYSKWFPEMKSDQFFTPDELERRLLILLEDKELESEDREKQVKKARELLEGFTINNRNIYSKNIDPNEEIRFPQYYDVAITQTKPVLSND